MSLSLSNAHKTYRKFRVRQEPKKHAVLLSNSVFDTYLANRNTQPKMRSFASILEPQDVPFPADWLCQVCLSSKEVRIVLQSGNLSTSAHLGQEYLCVYNLDTCNGNQDVGASCDREDYRDQVFML